MLIEKANSVTEEYHSINNKFGLLRKKTDLVEFEQFAQIFFNNNCGFFSLAHPKVGLLFVIVKPSLMYSLAYRNTCTIVHFFWLNNWYI